MDINETIVYSCNWKTCWENVSDAPPKFNRLLKAIFEQNVDEMEYLFKHGASLKATDEDTRLAVLWYVIDNYAVMSSLVRHGLSRIAPDVNRRGDNGCNEKYCINSQGYHIGLSAWAYYRSAYDVLDLLLENGFDDFTVFDQYYPCQVDIDILKSGKWQDIQILLRHGYQVKTSLVEGKRWFERYVIDRAQVRRISVGLDNSKFSSYISKPAYESVPLIFGRKEALYRNKRLREDYEDRARAIREFQERYNRAYPGSIKYMYDGSSDYIHTRKRKDWKEVGKQCLIALFGFCLGWLIGVFIGLSIDSSTMTYFLIFSVIFGAVGAYIGWQCAQV